MKILTFISLLLLPFSPLFGQSSGLVTESMLEESLDQIRSQPLGSLSVEEYLELSVLWDIYHQQQDFIKNAGIASYLIPGLGQIMAKDAPGATLMILGNVALSAGVLVGTHLLLPRSVQIGTLDYFGSSFATIEQAWKDVTLLSLLPSLGVATAGSIIMHLFRDLAADDARLKAQQALATQKVILSPRVEIERAGQFVFGIQLSSK